MLRLVFRLNKYVYILIHTCKIVRIVLVDIYYNNKMLKIL